MAQDKNAFGGGNPRGLYVPLSEDEQEVIHRTVESQTLRILVHEWSLELIPFWVGVGDKRVAIKFDLPVPEGVSKDLKVRSLDLELRAFESITLLRKPYPTILPDGTPLLVNGGDVISLQWDIAIDHIDPNLVKTIKPMALGLTTRRLDPVTGTRTLTGNMHYDDERKNLLRFVEAGEKRVERESLQDLQKALKS